MLQSDPRVKLTVSSTDKPIKHETLLRRVKGVNVLCPLLTDLIDAEVMDAAGPSLKMIANYAVGFDNIDLSAAKERNIIVTNAATPEVSESVAEHTIALMFALAHRLIETDDFTRAGKYHGWGPAMFLGTDLAKKTLGIIGGGAIGMGLARRLRDGFDMTILYSDIKRNEALEKETGAVYASKEDLLKRSDFVSLHVPLTQATRHLISRNELAIMKPTAYLINTARGPVVDEQALIAALKSSQIAGAGLDVFECEPLIACTKKQTEELRKLKNVVLTPHTASATIEARQAMSRVMAENVIAFMNGQQPKNAVTVT